MEGIEPTTEKYASAWPAWGHRKIWAMMRADHYEVSASSVLRAMARRNLLQPVRYQRGRPCGEAGGPQSRRSEAWSDPKSAYTTR